MEATDNSIKLYYNTEREKLGMPEYGRYILEMVEKLKAIPDREKRTEQAYAVVKSMEILNPQVRQLEDYSHKLWDHLFMIAGPGLEVDSPFPAPTEEALNAPPQRVPRPEKSIKAYHYGRNIESIIELIATEPDGEIKTSVIRSLAIYMRQQYLIWNKDSVSDETIFADIEKLSDGRIKVPKEICLSKVSENANFSRPGIMGNGNAAYQSKKNNWKNKRKGGKGQR